MLAQNAQLDGLTGLWNRAHLDRRLAEELSALQRRRLPLSCIMLDVDYFKSINDRFGHPCGDEVLRLIGALLMEHSRAEDIVCRYGGEEFTILCPGVGACGAVTLAERLRREIAAAELSYAGHTVPVTCSFGVAEASLDGSTMLGQADECLYRSKVAGRNRVTVHGDATAIAS